MFRRPSLNGCLECAADRVALGARQAGAAFGPRPSLLAGRRRRVFSFLKRLAGGRQERVSAGSRTVEQLAAALGQSPIALRSFSPAYSEFEVPKRSGGTRHIAAPDRGTQNLQRTIFRRLLAMPPVHPDSLGFVRGRGTLDHAARHAGSQVVLRMDLEDFFGSTSAGRVGAFFRETWDEEATALLVGLTTFRGSLPQGAPTSPSLSNLVNHRLDRRLAGFATRRGATYSRYADDITFSLKRDDVKLVRDLIRFTKLVMADAGYRLHQRRKLHVRRRHQRQLVGGLVVNDWPRLPRERRRWLRSVEHHLATGRHATLTPAQLAGWRAYRSMIDARAKPADAAPEISGGPAAS